MNIHTMQYKFCVGKKLAKGFHLQRYCDWQIYIQIAVNYGIFIPSW